MTRFRLVSNSLVFLISVFILIASQVFARQVSQLQDSITTQQDSSQVTTLKDSTFQNKAQKDSSKNQSPNKSKEIEFKDMITLGAFLVALAGLFFGIYRHRKSIETAKKIEQAKQEVQEEYEKKLMDLRLEGAKKFEIAKMQAKDEHEEQKQFRHAQTAEEQYTEALKEELGSIRLLGSPDIENVPVNLLDAFVSLDISESWRSEKRFQSCEMSAQPLEDRHSSPEEVLQRAFKYFRLLLIIGDPGSGKTTLMKYYAMSCLRNHDYNKFGFDEPILPIYFPLRELEPKDGKPASLPKNLAKWAKDHVLNVSEEDFFNWLHNRKTLILLDGLDEISNLKQRRRVCEWIDHTCAGLKQARFVVTSRWTGYRKSDGVELEFDHLRADVRDFSPQQQQDFLTKWFRAVYQRKYDGKDEPQNEWIERQIKLADERVKKVIDFLQDEKNKGLRQLAAVPMLLQIMAILWQERDVLPDSRSELYNASLNYLLDFRDKRRNLSRVLPAEKARRVLSPTALWMQDTLQKDEAPKNEVHSEMQPILDTMENQPKAETFCQNLIDRAGLLADYGDKDYIFRHKSFREYLAGIQLMKESKREEWLQKLIRHFGEDWWEEPLRFFMCEADDAVFDKFIQLFFQSDKSRDLDQKEQNLLQTLVREAPQKKVTALGQKLMAEDANDNQKRYILECLKNIEMPAAKKQVKIFLDKKHGNDATLSYAKEVVQPKPVQKEKLVDIFAEDTKSFQNDVEDGATYIIIPAGEFTFSVTEGKEPVPKIALAKYPVTNKRYRRFLAYLSGKSSEFQRILPLTVFTEKLLEFADTIKDVISYLGWDAKSWPQRLRSQEDENKRFNDEDQPVVSITWFAARVYCFWLSCLEQVQVADKNLQDLEKIAIMYRLPNELEWEWAAAGREPDGSLREYPWPKEKGEPNEKLANYNRNVGATTPVGRYTEGATPEGLVDLAGNVWEWMENWYDDREDARALRGGSWLNGSDYLRCDSRVSYHPDLRDYGFGFRVVRVQSKN